MRILGLILGLVLIAALAWLFVIVMFPLARRVGLFKKDGDK